MKLIFSLFLVTCFSSIYAQSDVIKDLDGNVYKTQKIGSQIWMAENLKTTKYNDSTKIDFIPDNTAWGYFKHPGYCWYNNNEAYKDTCGALYNWYAVNPITNGNKNICPSGWHIPTYDEYLKLISFLGGDSIAGGKLKITGTNSWKSPNTNAVNSSGFNGLSAGYRAVIDNSVTFEDLGYFTYFWTSTEYNTFHVDVVGLYFMSGEVRREYMPKEWGISIRCLKDNSN